RVRGVPRHRRDRPVLQRRQRGTTAEQGDEQRATQGDRYNRQPARIEPIRHRARIEPIRHPARIEPIRFCLERDMNKPAEPIVGDTRRVPYAKPQPWGMVPDMVVHDVLAEDERLWAPVAPDIWSRPLQLNVTGGFYVHLLRVRRSGVLQRHRHSGQVHAYVMKGSWFYLEHDWVAR